MIYSVRGKLIHTGPNLAVVECGGVGYACRTTNATLSSLPKRGGEIMLYTYLYMTENDLALFGFASESELQCFRQIITVSGVGPKVALAILSDLTPDRLALSVAAGDYKTLTKSPGVGNKIAQRIVLELKDKLALEGMSSGGAEVSTAAAAESGSVGEAVSALEALGYSRTEAVTAVAGLNASLPVEELIKGGLKALSAHK